MSFTSLGIYYQERINLTEHGFPFPIISPLKDTQYQNNVGLSHELGLAASMNVALEKQDKEANVTI